MRAGNTVRCKVTDLPDTGPRLCSWSCPSAFLSQLLLYSIFWDEGQYQVTFWMKFFWTLYQSTEENNQATLLPLHPAVFSILIPSHSSNVEKDGILHRNVHRWLFWIRIKNFLIFVYYYRSWWTFSTKIYLVCSFWSTWAQYSKLFQFAQLEMSEL